MRWEHIVPCSAVSGEQVDVLADVLVSLLDRGARVLPGRRGHRRGDRDVGRRTDPGGGAGGVRDELPHSIAVEIDEMGLREGRPDDRPLLDIFASLVVERDSQKPIMIGRGGEHVGNASSDTGARSPRCWAPRCTWTSKVKVLKDWQRDPKYLNRLGFWMQQSRIIRQVEPLGGWQRLALLVVTRATPRLSARWTGWPCPPTASEPSASV